MSGRRGQALTEFALVMPLFVALLLLTFEAGRLVLTWSCMLEGSREAARTAVLKRTTATAPVVNAALDLTGWSGVTAADVTVSRNGSAVSGTFSKQRGDEIAVSISFTYTVFIAQSLGSALPSLPFVSLPITVQTQMRAEG
jgi:Flp pilus assembly protein TadG